MPLFFQLHQKIHFLVMVIYNLAFQPQKMKYFLFLVFYEGLLQQ